MLKKISVVFLIGLVAWAYQASHPPLPRICGSAGGPPITAPRIKLRDGRHLAYKEHGVHKDMAKNKVVFIHGFGSCRHDAMVATNLPLELAEEVGVYIVSFDRPGYGESDPDPHRTPRSLALDIEELADQLGLGSKFYVMGHSMGAQVVWSCLRYIPHRLAGATLIAPVINYWWRSLPSNLSMKAYYEQPQQDRWALRVVHYMPMLAYWWITQNWFPTSSVVARNPHIFSLQDLQIIPKIAATDLQRSQVKQQGESESICRDMIVGFGSWDFDPIDLHNPFPNNEGYVHLWQGDEDKLVPVMLQRYIVDKLPWIKYHELAGAGHLFPYMEEMSVAIVKTQLVAQNY